VGFEDQRHCAWVDEGIWLKVKNVTANGKGVQYVCCWSGHIRDVQTIANNVRKAKRRNFPPEMLSKVATNCENASRTEYKTWGFGLVHS